MYSIWLTCDIFQPHTFQFQIHQCFFKWSPRLRFTTVQTSPSSCKFLDWHRPIQYADRNYRADQEETIETLEQEYGALCKHIADAEGELHAAEADFDLKRLMGNAPPFEQAVLDYNTLVSVTVSAELRFPRAEYSIDIQNMVNRHLKTTIMALNDMRDTFKLANSMFDANVVTEPRVIDAKKEA